VVCGYSNSFSSNFINFRYFYIINDLIKQIIKTKAESQTIEVKAANKGTPRRLYDTLSSFSNQDSGGIIVFGIDESLGFKPVGVYDLQDLQKK